MKITLSPIKTIRKMKWNETKTYVENVALISDGFPWAITHIDTFFDKDDNAIYNRLIGGEVLNVSLSIVKDEISEQDKKEVERVNLAILAGMPNPID